MDLKRELLKEIVKQGYSVEDGNRVWNISKRDFLFMDDELSDGFLKVRSHPRYRSTIIDKEIELLNQNKEIISKDICNGPFNLIDMGCGDGTKTNALLNLLNCDSADIRLVPVNISKKLVDLTVSNVKKNNYSFVKEYKETIASFESLDKVSSELRGSNYPRNVVLLLGSILASFDINDYLFHLSNSMFAGDYLIIGNGIRKGERLVGLENYKHPVFNEWFMGLMKLIGFKEGEVEYDARFNEVRIEMFYTVKSDKVIEFDDKKIEFKKGDEILVANLYKYYENELKEFCEMYFSDVKLFKDKDEEYALVLCKK